MVLVDLDTSKLVGLAPSRKHCDIVEAMKDWGAGVLEQIAEVSMDLSGNYRGLVKKQMPNAQIVADRFHVMQQVNPELNQVRNRELRANQSQPESDIQASITKLLKTSKYALLKPEANLTHKQQQILEQVKQVSPLLAQMHGQKEALRHVFESATDWDNGMEQLAEWIVSAEPTFRTSTQTLTNWFDEIANYFRHRTSNGIVEGINNKLKLIKRLGYGFRNFTNFERRCLICWHLDFSSA